MTQALYDFYRQTRTIESILQTFPGPTLNFPG